MTQTLEKVESETKTFDMDFTKALRSSETIASVDSVSATSKDYVADSEALIFSNQTFDGNITQFTISGGTSQEEYSVNVTITTTSNDIRVGSGTLRVL